jgi:hypothetical protein
MPSKNKSQKDFFEAAMNAKKTEKTKSVANRMTKTRVKHFLKIANEEQKKKLLVGFKKLKETMTGINCPAEPSMLQEDNIELYSYEVEGYIDNNDNVHVMENGQDKIRVGQALRPKELESITNFKGVKPTKFSTKYIKFEKTDFNSNIATIILKLLDKNQYIFMAFQKYKDLKPGQPETPEPGAEATPDGEENKLKLTKSPPIENNDEVKGGEVLSEFLIKLAL